MQDSVCANPIAGSGRNKPSKLMRNRTAVSAIPEVDVCLARLFCRPDWDSLPGNRCYKTWSEKADCNFIVMADCRT